MSCLRGLLSEPRTNYPMTVRIFTVCHSSPLMVVQHLRRHLDLPPAREFLLHGRQPNAPWMTEFMSKVIATAGFSGSLDLDKLESVHPRTQGPIAWWFESARRSRRDAAAVRRWMKENEILENEIELWTEEPIHFDTLFTWALLPDVRHVKYPECLYREDDDSQFYKQRVEARWTKASWARKHIYWPWLRLVSGLDYGRRPEYVRGYTFDRPNPWTRNSIDVSRLITIEAFRETYQQLPSSIRGELEQELRPIQAGRRPLVLLLLFGLGPDSSRLFESCVRRIFAERRSELASCTLAVKFHPGATGDEENALVARLDTLLPGRVFPLRSGLNLEFILPELRPDYVLGGPSGAMPILRKLNGPRPIALPEITDALVQVHPEESAAYELILRDIEVW